jgi:beta-glucosidase
MRINFPDDFVWGTSTAAAQVETASDHNWRGLVSKDGYTFVRTTDHELRREEDAAYIGQLGNLYRCGLDWARLQPAAYAPFDEAVVEEYRHFFALLCDKGVSIMLVVHHFTHPRWLEAQGGWVDERCIACYVDYLQQCLDAFGSYVRYWNTFNEPNVFALNAYVLGNFPPCRKLRFDQAHRVLKHMGKAHDIAYACIKQRFPTHPVGISLNTAWFEGLNLAGRAVAAFMDYWFHRYAARPFEQVDFWGLSYYAYVLFDPFPITEIDRPGALQAMGQVHDKMWGYRPEGLGLRLREFWQRYYKPLWVTENGICTDDDAQRIQAIDDYVKICHEVVSAGIPLKGYIHWSTWDNFEWNLGPTYRFGLVRVDWTTMDRRMTAAGEYYARLVAQNALII